MKSLFRLTHGLPLILLLSSFGCGGREEDPCDKPHPIPTDSIEARNEWLIRNKVGDSITFRVYKVEGDSIDRKYFYQGNETYVAIRDTFITVLAPFSSGSYPCATKKYNVQKALQFKGNRRLECWIQPAGVFDNFILWFAGKRFQIADNQYNNSGSWFYQNLEIGGKKYSTVNSFPGFPENSLGSNYIDSTVAFYNSDYGMLKFIVNDTLALVRAQ
jgi:hypothetical protein